MGSGILKPDLVNCLDEFDSNLKVWIFFKRKFEVSGFIKKLGVRMYSLKMRCPDLSTKRNEVSEFIFKII